MRKITPAILLISATAAGCGSVAAPPLSAMQACMTPDPNGCG